MDEVRLAGVSGWLPAMRADLRQLLARKRKMDDYDVLIMEDHARLTRTGLDGTLEIETKFGKCGVQIVYLTEVMPMDYTAGKAGLSRPRR
ncbi:MAG: recombinase family protein [Planctomycetota bacterium]|nr:recombinase family protein [Planctomycetota bacterium]